MLSLFLSLACDSPPERKITFHASTAGERAYESLFYATQGQACQQEKLLLLNESKHELVRHIDRLLERFPVEAPNPDLIRQRLLWLKNTNIEGFADQIAGFLKNRREDISQSIETLSHNFPLALSTETQAWSALQFVQKGEFRIFLNNLRAEIAEFANPSQNETREIIAILTTLQRFLISKEGGFLRDYGKRFLTDKATRDFLLDLADKTQGHSKFLENLSLRFCLSESWTPVRSFLCLQGMTLLGLDKDLSIELLDYGAILYQRGIITDLLRLKELIQEIRLNHLQELKFIEKIAQDLGISLSNPSRDKIDHFVAGFSILFNIANADPNESFPQTEIDIAKSLVALDDMIDSSEERIKGFDSLLKQISREDLQAVFAISKVAFSLWSLSLQNGCRPTTLSPLSAQNLNENLAQFSSFLTAPKYGFKSWLSLLRRLAHDLES